MPKRSVDPTWPSRFIRALGDLGSPAAAAREAEINVRTAYARRRQNEAFREAWDEAIDRCTDLMEAEAKRRAVDGWDDPVYSGGQRIGMIRRYSDQLLMFLLKANRPEKYRDNYDITKLARQINAIANAKDGPPPSVGSADHPRIDGSDG